jgi:hypothetical protein
MRQPPLRKKVLSGSSAALISVAILTAQYKPYDHWYKKGSISTFFFWPQLLGTMQFPFSYLVNISNIIIFK